MAVHQHILILHPITLYKIICLLKVDVYGVIQSIPCWNDFSNHEMADIEVDICFRRKILF